MKIKSARISNILSFRHYDDIGQAPAVIFDTSGSEGSLHILIGPNGSGKSNFVDIIHHIFRRTFSNLPNVNESIIEQSKGDLTPGQAGRLKEAITNAAGNPWILKTNRDTPGSPMRMRVIIALNNDDRSNLLFLYQHRDQINKLFEKYSRNNSSIPSDVALELLSSMNEYELDIENVGPQQVPALIPSRHNDGLSTLIQQYLVYFDYFSAIIRIHNKYELSEESFEEWPALENTFGFLGSYRNYSAISSTIDVSGQRNLTDIHQRFGTESTRTVESGEPIVFELVKRKIAPRYVELVSQQGESYAEATILNEPLVATLNLYLKRFLSLTLRVTRPNVYVNQIKFDFIDQSNKVTDSNDLSAGQKGIIHFIFTLLGNEVRNGVLVIDEPELHLHPQVQKEYLVMMDAFRRKFDLQIIVVTHSAIFVTRDTIEHVYRFLLRDGATQIVHPDILPEQKALTKILELTNASKIFFVDNVLLVEGPTDEFFWRHFIASATQLKSEDLEVISISGKASRTEWTEFLEKFGLKVSFCGDWDNINEVFDIDTQTYVDQIRVARRKAGKAITKKNSVDGERLIGDAYSVVHSNCSPDTLSQLKTTLDYIVSRHVRCADIVHHMQTTAPQEFTRLVNRIEAKYAEGIFILKEGELEDYLGIVKPASLERIITFCRDEYDTWSHDPNFSTKREELAGFMRAQQ